MAWVDRCHNLAHNHQPLDQFQDFNKLSNGLYTHLSGVSTDRLQHGGIHRVTEKITHKAVIRLDVVNCHGLQITE
ncbi:MAG: hypothetical protein P8163_16095 [Candidatus Thiodiazotropha sp.]